MSRNGHQDVTFAADNKSLNNIKRPTWTKLKSSAYSTATAATAGRLSREDIVAHGRCLCGQYMRARLKRAGCLNRKVTQRLRTMIDATTTLATRDVFSALNTLGEELERMHPRVYSNLSRQLSRAPFGELQDADTAPYLLHATAKELFKGVDGISWAKIISMFAICGGLAVDIVRQGHYDYLQRLIDGTADIIDEELVAWIGANGSWKGLLEHIHPPMPVQSISNWLSLLLGCMVVFYILTNFCRWLGASCFRLVRGLNSGSGGSNGDGGAAGDAMGTHASSVER